MITIIRTDSENKDFIKLVKNLDAYLKVTDGDEHDFYNQYNNIDILNGVIIAYKNENPLGCGAIKEFDRKTTEIKRMYVSPESRGLGIASKILSELENWTKELGYKKCILETGIRQVEAVRFYKKNDYKLISNYGQYKDIENSICFEKQI